MHQEDSFADLGVVAIAEAELSTIRGGFGAFALAIAASVIGGALIQVLNDLEGFAQGFKEGYEFVNG